MRFIAICIFKIKKKVHELFINPGMPNTWPVSHNCPANNLSVTQLNIFNLSGGQKLMLIYPTPLKFLERKF